MEKSIGIVSYPNAWCPRCRNMLQCVQRRGRIVKGIECPYCKLYCDVVSRSKGPLKGFKQGHPLFLEQ